MANSKRRRWTLDFLRELTVSGDARVAAERAGVDHSEVWLRRLQEPHFAAYWEAALRLRADFAARIERGPSGPPLRSWEG